MKLSVAQQLSGRTVLLTGGLGGVGSCCLEQLLRLTNVHSVLLLVRSKLTRTAETRVQKLLSGPIFQALHKEALTGGRNVFNKVKIVEGDLGLPGLGLSSSDKQLLIDQVEVVLHSAADLALDINIQRTLRTNYCGTRQLLELAGDMSRLQSFLFVSTYYVNNFKPFNSHVKEEVHNVPLQLAGKPTALSHGQLVDLLLSLSADEAAAEASALMARLNFVSTYAFGKLLTEQLVDDPASLPGVAKAIVRPSLVTTMAGGCCPGYCTGLAGAPSYCLGYGAGLFHDMSGVAFASDAVVDLIPVDTVSSLIIVAAAAAAANGPYTGDRAKVYHAASAGTNPVSSPKVFEILHAFYSANDFPGRLPFARLPVFTGRHNPTLQSMWLSNTLTAWKVWLAIKVLQLCGQTRQAQRLDYGFKTFCVQNTPNFARSFISLADNAVELQASLAPEEADQWCCAWEKGKVMDWDTYMYTGISGLHNLVFKVPASSLQTPVPHLFVQPKGLSDLAVMQQWMAEEQSSDRDRSSACGKAEDDGQAPGLPLGRVTVTVTACGSDADMAACKDQQGMVAGA